MMKLMTALTVAAFLLLAVMPTTVSAEEAKQNQHQKAEQEIEFVCETHSYGQTTCRAKGKTTLEQDQDQYILRKDGRYVRVHRIDKVKTGVPAVSAVITGLVSIAGTGLYLIKRV